MLSVNQVVATQYSLHEVTGSRNYVPPLLWDCPSCG